MSSSSYTASHACDRARLWDRWKISEVLTCTEVREHARYGRLLIFVDFFLADGGPAHRHVQRYTLHTSQHKLYNRNYSFITRVTNKCIHRSQILDIWEIQLFWKNVHIRHFLLWVCVNFHIKQNRTQYDVQWNAFYDCLVI